MSFLIHLFLSDPNDPVVQWSCLIFAISSIASFLAVLVKENLLDNYAHLNRRHFLSSLNEELCTTYDLVITIKIVLQF